MYYWNGLSLCFHKIRINGCALVSINHMRASYSRLTTSLSRFNILVVVPSVECKCGDRLQMEEHVIWDCKLY
jgi:hypothetical protein